MSHWLLVFTLSLQIVGSHAQMEKALGMILRTGNCAAVISGMDWAFIKVQCVRAKIRPLVKLSLLF